MEQTRRAFARMVAAGDGSLDGHLDEAALLIAQAVDPAVDVAEQLGRLDQLANEFAATTPAELAMSLFGGIAGFDADRHFAGNQDSYYDPQNSLLHRVLDRRIGIPITLSVLLIETGRRSGLALHGVGMPGHFLVGFDDGFIDTFHRGVLLDEAGCLERFQSLAGPNSRLPDGSLAPTPPELIVRRMLLNLAAIGANQQRRRILRASRALLAAFPNATHRDHVQHAFAAAEIGQFGEAATAADRAMPDVPEQVQHKLAQQIDGWRARLN